MPNYICAETVNGNHLFDNAGTSEVAGFATNYKILYGGGDDSSILLGKHIYSTRNTSNIGNAYLTYLHVTVPRYMPVATMVCNAFSNNETIKALLIESVAKSATQAKIIGTFQFEDGYIQDYSIHSEAIEINFEFAKLVIDNRVTNTSGYADSRNAN